MQSWKIEGHDGLTKIFETTAPHVMSENEITTLLQRLACQHLTQLEIVAASLRSNLQGYTALLEPHVDSGTAGNFTILVGQSPHYTATCIRGAA